MIFKALVIYFKMDAQSTVFC